ncbi:hypothetical protein LTR94_029775, partial [Friedmanniomyces endolithicus]
LTPEELRYTQFYKVGQQVTVTGHIPELGLRRGGTYEVTRVFTNKVEMRRGSEKIRFAPQKLDPTVTLERLQISTLDSVRLHEGETIRWTTNDTERGMDNAALATVTGIENDLAVIDVGLKSEGRVPLREFAPAPGQKAELKVGDEVEVYVDRVENMHGEAMLSRDRARREAAWDKLELEFSKSARVEGVIFGRVKGGFTVDLNGAVAFLPGSQVDIRPVRDVTPLMDIPQPFQILKMDRKRGNIV